MLCPLSWSNQVTLGLHLTEQRAQLLLEGKTSPPQLPQQTPGNREGTLPNHVSMFCMHSHSQLWLSSLIGHLEANGFKIGCHASVSLYH